MARDWRVKPFTSIEVHEDECPPGSEDVFYRQWAGSVEGCEIREEDVAKIHSIIPMDAYEKDPNQKKACSHVIDSVAPIKQTKFFGRSICGIRGS